MDMQTVEIPMSMCIDLLSDRAMLADVREWINENAVRLANLGMLNALDAIMNREYFKCRRSEDLLTE